MAYPLRLFRPERTHCPSCHLLQVDSVMKCPQCGFSAAASLHTFPMEFPTWERLTDPKGFLKGREWERLDSQIAALEESYPQLSISICFHYLRRNQQPSEFGFWFLNYAKENGAPSSSRAKRESSLLLVVDYHHHRCSATVGYLLEPFLSDFLLRDLLTTCLPEFSREKWGEALSKFFLGLSDELAKRHLGAREIINRATEAEKK
ncbi:MAG: TPM domain-containing protein [Verrucomicrobiota bacterium]